jgi:hypothetical protein
MKGNYFDWGKKIGLFSGFILCYLSTNSLLADSNSRTSNDESKPPDASILTPTKKTSPNPWEQALRDGNFIVMYPTLLPSSLKETESSFREENPSREECPRCSLRTIVKDNVGRQLSIKQFNYDWAPPAYDCPALWHNPEFSQEEIPEPMSHLIGHNVLWIGKNYRNQPAATITSNRTTIEITGLSGDFIKEEFISIAKNLTPLDFERQKSLKGKSFAELSYKYPSKVKIVDVPISFWKVPPKLESGLKYQISYTAQEAPKELLEDRVCIPEKEGYSLNSIFVYQGQEEPSLSDRVEYIYEHNEILGATIRLIRSHKSTQFSFNYPPEPDVTQKFRHSTLDINKKIVYHAYRSEDYGPHEAVWDQGEYNYLLLVKPTSWTTRSWFSDFLVDMLHGK